MIDKDKIWTSNDEFMTATGLEIGEAKLLLDDFTNLLYKKRHSKSKAGRPSKLEPKDIFLMLLIFIRQYVTLKFLGIIFNLNASNVKRWIDDSYEVLSEILVKKELCPLDSSKSKEDAQECLKQLGKVYIDGTEQTVRRPKNSKEQRENYSGKKKKHTSKILVITDENKSIKVITPVYVGSSHDYGIFKEEKLEEILPSKMPIYVDTGFEGINELCPDCDIRKPKKKPRKRKLNGGEKLGNSIISKERVKVEHAIGGFKKFKSVSDCFRGITQSMDTMIKVACGLWNYHLSYKCQNAYG